MPRHSPYALIRLNFIRLVLSIFSLELLEFLEHFFRFVNSCEKVLSFCSWISFSTFRWNCNFTQIGKTYNFFANLVKNYLSSYLFVSYSSILFIRFSMNITLAADTVGWWAQVDSNHRPRAYQARALTTWAMSPFSFSRCISFTLTFFFSPRVLALKLSALGRGDSPPGGDDGNRTHDPLLAGQVLSQLSYTPIG